MIKKIAIGIAIFFVVLVAASQILGQMSSTVVIEHTLNAPVAKVWQMWNDPETIKKWWGPGPYTCPVAQNDLRVGGGYLLSMQDPKGKVIFNVGKYIEIVDNKKIVSLMAFADDKGNPVPAETYGIPGKWPDAIKVSVEFTEQGERTHVRIEETGIPTIMYLFAKLGWSQQFEKFDALLN